LAVEFVFDLLAVLIIRRRHVADVQPIEHFVMQFRFNLEYALPHRAGNAAFGFEHAHDEALSAKFDHIAVGDALRRMRCD
jgi:hypothetical protein